jgi:Mg-chelatase subunit ChlD
MNAGSGGTGGGNCGAENHQAMIKPLAIYLMVDWSASMTEREDLWTPVKTALNAFVSDASSAGIQVALGYFPVTSEDIVVKCDATQYVTPSVAMAPLPTNAAPITASLETKMFTLGENPPPNDRLSTPTAPAMTGSLQYMTQWLAQYPDHTGVVVLATDGEPAGCDEASMMAGMPVSRGTPEEIAASVDAIAAAASATPAVKTYVIGIGNLMATLDQLAAAGDTGKNAFIVDATGTNTQTEFLEAMKEIRGSALPCSYGIPTPTVGDLDYSKVNVDYAPDDTGTNTVPFVKVENAAACGTATNAWYYDDPEHPSSIELCPSACQSARDTGMSNLSVVSVSLGCETRVL